MAGILIPESCPAHTRAREDGNLDLVILAVLWTLWCFIHSILISRTVVRPVRKKLGDGYRFYRLFYNTVSVVTLVPVLFYSASLSGDALFDWAGPWRPVQVLLALGALLFFATGARHYDLRQFVGLRQIAEHETGKGLTETGELDTSGVLGVVRHPWYAGGILILWARPLDPAALITNAVLTVYLVAGAFLEEAKLVEEFGNRYRKYQEKVPMFLPTGLLRGTKEDLPR